MNSPQKRRLVAVVACVGIFVLLAGFIYFFLGVPDPSYAGRRLSSWFRESAMQSNVIPDAPSTKAIQALGGAAAPYLVMQVCHQDSWWDEFYRKRYPKTPPRLRRWLLPPLEPRSREETAAKLLAQIGPAAHGLFPKMLQAYNRSYLEHFHLPLNEKLDWSRHLTNATPVSPQAKPTFSQWDNFRFWLLSDLAAAGADRREVVPLFLSAIQEPDNGYRATIRDLAKASSTNLVTAIRLSEPELLFALSDSVPDVRSTAATMLGMIAPEHPELVSPLMNASDQDADPAVRRAALESLIKTPAKLETLLPLLGRVFTDTNSTLRGIAAGKIIRAGGGARFVDTLTGDLSNQDPAVRAAAAQILGSFRSRSKPAIPQLTQHASESTESDPQVRAEASAALAKIASAEHPN